MTDDVTLTVTVTDVTALSPDPRNARTHSDEQIDQIAASIKEFGWTNPILADADGMIIAGHGRLMAAHRLQMTHVPVITLSHLTPQQRAALAIADNKLALNAGWDDEALKREIEELLGFDFDVTVLGFSNTELDDLLDDAEDEGEGGDADNKGEADRWGVIVTVKSEKEQAKLLERLMDEGYDVRSIL